MLTQTIVTTGIDADGQPYRHEHTIVYGAPRPQGVERQQVPFTFPFFMPTRQEPAEDKSCDPTFVKQLPQATSCEGKECYICLDSLEGKQESAQLPCGHAFDRGCIEKWLD